MNLAYVFEPLNFIFTGDFFKGLPLDGNKSYKLASSLSDAYKFAFEKDLPSTYKVWQDVIEGYRQELRSVDDFDNADDIITVHLEELQKQHASDLLSYRKKKLKKINTEYDDFFFSDAREDAYFVLSTVAINRFLDSPLRSSLLEEIFNIYKNGGWPCGLKNNELIVFNPNILKK